MIKPPRVNSILRITIFFLIPICIYFSLGKILQYYFYADDYSILYHIQQNITPEWPYKFVALSFSPLYKLFGLESFAYSLLGIVTYYAAAIAVLFFIFSLVKNKTIAILSSLIFSTGYIGLDQFTQLFVSPLNNINIINVCLTLILFVRYIDTRKIRFYLLTVFFYFVSVYISPFRAFPLLLFLPIIDLGLTFQYESFSKMSKRIFLLIVKHTPFFAIAFCLGVFTYRTQGVDNVSEYPLGKLSSLLSEAFIKEIFAILGRFVLLPSFTGLINFSVFNIEEVYFIAGLFFSLIICSILLYVFLFRSMIKTFYNKEYSLKYKYLVRLCRVQVIFLGISIGGFIGNMVLLPNFDSNGAVNRYLSLSFVGYSGLLPIFIYLICCLVGFLKTQNQRLWLVAFLIFPIILNMILLSRNYEEQIIQGRSLPSHNFYKDLKKYVPELSKPSLFYFDHADYYPTSAQFSHIMTGAYLPREASLAVHYNEELGSIKIANSFNELLSKIKKDPKQNYFTFYYDEIGLHDTTADVANLLSMPKKIDLLKEEKNNSDIFSPQIEYSPTNVSSLIPFDLYFSFRAMPLEPSVFSFPFTKFKENDPLTKLYTEGKIDKDKIFSYLVSRNKYYETVKVNVSSTHVSLMYPGDLLVDDDIGTYWLDKESSFVAEQKSWVEIDLGEERNIGKLLWINESVDREPRDFEILTSKDKNAWDKVQVNLKEKFDIDLSTNKMVAVSFESRPARFVRFEVRNTLGRITPGLSEIEIVEDIYRDVDLVMARRLKNNPFEYISSIQDLSSTYEYLKNNSTLTIKTLTNREREISDIYDLKLPIVVDGAFHEYLLPILPRGLELRKIVFQLPYPAIIQIKDIWLEYKYLGK